MRFVIAERYQQSVALSTCDCMTWCPEVSGLMRLGYQRPCQMCYSVHVTEKDRRAFGLVPGCLVFRQLYLLPYLAPSHPSLQGVLSSTLAVYARMTISEGRFAGGLTGKGFVNNKCSGLF
jgi:hypothetical protein